MCVVQLGEKCCFAMRLGRWDGSVLKSRRGRKMCRCTCLFVFAILLVFMVQHGYAALVTGLTLRQGTKSARDMSSCMLLFGCSTGVALWL